jgi:hypothetical protein
MDHGVWLEDLTDWLESFIWQWFCTLTLRPSVSSLQAARRLQRWASELGDACGTTDFGWIAVPENGRTGFHFHYHVLVGGLKPGLGAAERLDSMRRWWHLAGDARIDDFKEGVGGVRYIVKGLTPQNFQSVELHLASNSKSKIKGMKA